MADTSSSICSGVTSMLDPSLATSALATRLPRDRLRGLHPSDTRRRRPSAPKPAEALTSTTNLNGPLQGSSVGPAAAPHLVFNELFAGEIGNSRDFDGFHPESLSTPLNDLTVPGSLVPATGTSIDDHDHLELDTSALGQMLSDGSLDSLNPRPINLKAYEVIAGHFKELRRKNDSASPSFDISENQRTIQHDLLMQLYFEHSRKQLPGPPHKEPACFRGN
ncbi:Uu.00g107140.m01.CDS01 [Anthostomella pinea]|uniref:Uu.00g107140.m01.CDS01 n=1 Tax=Anthostomella pinea TaxID=933095 RepID=A0AAI8V958_9PEZI|nr:Uu.00g107140.m01.CDS01 [Anthostomella pinea]